MRGRSLLLKDCRALSAFPCVEKTTRVAVKNLFEYNLEFYREHYKELKAVEDSGEPVCWDNDAALLVSHGIF